MSITVIAAQAATTHASSCCCRCVRSAPRRFRRPARSGSAAVRARASVRAAGDARRQQLGEPDDAGGERAEQDGGEDDHDPAGRDLGAVPGPTRTEKLSVTKPPTARIPRTARRVGESGISEPVARTNPPMLRNQSAAVSAERAWAPARPAWTSVAWLDNPVPRSPGRERMRQNFEPGQALFPAGSLRSRQVASRPPRSALRASKSPDLPYPTGARDRDDGGELDEKLGEHGELLGKSGYGNEREQSSGGVRRTGARAGRARSPGLDRAARCADDTGGESEDALHDGLLVGVWVPRMCTTISWYLSG